MIPQNIIETIQANKINADELDSPLGNINNQEKTSINSTFMQENVIIKGDTYSIVRIENTNYELLQNILKGNKIMEAQPIPRKEVEKEISRLDKDIADIKVEIKEMRKDIADIKENYVTKEYLNKEFKENMLNEIRVIFAEERKNNGRWLVGTAIAVIGAISTIISLLI